MKQTWKWAITTPEGILNGELEGEIEPGETPEQAMQAAATIVQATLKENRNSKILACFVSDGALLIDAPEADLIKLDQEIDLTPRIIVRHLPEPMLQLDYGTGERYSVEWEMWDTIAGKRVGPIGGQLFADQKTAQGFADKWNFAYGPPARCGSCGHVFAEGEHSFGHSYYNVLCYGCSASNED